MDINSHADLKARMTQESAGFGLIHDCRAVDPNLSPSKDIPYNLVDYFRMTPEGVRITSDRPIENGIQIGFIAYDRNSDEWKSYRAAVAHSSPSSGKTDSPIRCSNGVSGKKSTRRPTLAREIQPRG